MAEVQLAIQRGPGGFEKLVVVKLVHENLASQKTFVDMLLDEARVAALVKHPNVVDIYDLGEDGGRYFIAMEYLEGEPLLAVLRAGREGQRLDVASTARLIADTAEGLEAAHELRSMSGDRIELVHHDVSLGNIVVLYDGQVKLVDFGVAKASQSAATPAAGKVQGKFSYMAPEKLRGGSGDRRSDIFSLGCVLWEALTLRRLFKGGNDADTMKQVLESTVQKPSEVNGDVPTAFDPIVMKALERDPDQRYATAAQMAEDIEEVLRTMNYARKNAAIARYMQETFKEHIVARKKLLQEVSSKGRASTEILEAAFDEPLAQGSPVDGGGTGDGFSIKFKRSNFDLPPGAEEPVIITGAKPPIEEFSPAEKVKTGAEPLEPFTKWKTAASSNPEHAPAPATPTPVLQPRRKVSTLPPAPEPTRSRVLLIVGALAIVGVIVAAFVLSGRAKGPATDTPPPPKPAAPQPASAPPVDAPAPPDASEIELEPTTAPPDARAASTPRDAGVASAPLDAGHRTPGLDLDATFKLGLQALVRGDTRSALAEFKKVQSANATYAPAWRGLGLAYEKLGEIAQARASYQRYLQLAPAASDAPAIKKRLEALIK